MCVQIHTEGVTGSLGAGVTGIGEPLAASAGIWTDLSISDPSHRPIFWGSPLKWNLQISEKLLKSHHGSLAPSKWYIGRRKLLREKKGTALISKFPKSLVLPLSKQKPPLPPTQMLLPQISQDCYLHGRDYRSRKYIHKRLCHPLRTEFWPIWADIISRREFHEENIRQCDPP